MQNIRTKIIVIHAEIPNPTELPHMLDTAMPITKNSIILTLYKIVQKSGVVIVCLLISILI